MIIILKLLKTTRFLQVVAIRRDSMYKSSQLSVGKYEVLLLNNETARLEGALEGWGNKRVVLWVAANLLYSRTKTRFRHYFSMCAAAV